MEFFQYNRLMSSVRSKLDIFSRLSKLLLASNTSRSSSTHSVGSSGDPHKRLCNAAIAIAKKGYNPLFSKKRALIGEENTVEDTICKQGFSTANATNGTFKSFD